MFFPPWEVSKLSISEDVMRDNNVIYISLGFFGVFTPVEVLSNALC